VSCLQQTGQVLAQGGKDYIRHGIVVTAPRAILLILPPLVAAAPGLDGQRPPPGLDRPAIEVGADVGVSPNAAKAFANDQICPSRAALSAGLRAHARLARWFGTEVLGQYFFGNPGPSCVDGLLPPPPPQGPFTRRYDFFDERVTGYPFVLTTARVQILPYAGPAAAVRAFVGLGHIWSKRVTVPQAGFSVLLGHRALRFMVEADLWWYRVAQHRITEDFQDGQLVARRDDVARVRERTAVVRAGLTVPIPRRTP